MWRGFHRSAGLSEREKGREGWLLRGSTRYGRPSQGVWVLQGRWCKLAPEALADETAKEEWDAGAMLHENMSWLEVVTKARLLFKVKDSSVK